jgi:hypothetical protein
MATDRHMLGLGFALGGAGRGEVGLGFLGQRRAICSSPGGGEVHRGRQRHRVAALQPLSCFGRREDDG